MSGVRCPSCGAQNPDGQKFCGGCGGALSLTCARCGAENPAGFKFCGECGAGLAPVVANAPTEQRRWATMLFADLTGFTRLSETMDPEDVRAMIDACMARMGPIVERYGGVVTGTAGDALMTIFGAPTAHEDDPERAVRAALDIQRSLAEDREFAGLQFRIAVNTGEVMFAPTGPESKRDFTAMGDAVNAASRLETAADPGTVLVGEETYKASHRAIAYEEVGPLRVKGRDATINAWRAVGTTSAPGERPVSTVGMVGRSRELELLSQVWQGVVESKRPQLVTLLGEPGVGKTRLFREFARSIADSGGQVFNARSLPYSERSGYNAFGQLTKELAGILETDSDAESMDKLTRYVSGTVGDDDQSTPIALAVLSGLPTDEKIQEREVLFGAARRLVEGLARRRPLVLGFEDIQWADAGLLDLIEYLAAHVREQPLMVFTLSRPELLDSRPGWAGGLTGYTALHLDALGAEEAHDLAVQVLAARPGSHEAAHRILAAAAGNPLFIEEMAAWLEDASSEGQDVPTTIKAIIAARLDALPAAERQVILDAAVVGDVFWLGALQRLGPGSSVGTALESLEMRGLVRRDATSRIGGDKECSFKHGLIREVAYTTLPKASRKARHRVVAEFLEESLGDPAGTAAILARHWQEAGDDDRALRYLLAAADQASRSFATEAPELYTQALALVPESDVKEHRAIRLRRAVAFQRLVSVQMWSAGAFDDSPASEG